MLRICVVGSGGVGKSCVTIRFLKNEFTEYYDPTMEETYEDEIQFGGRTYDVEIVDTAGQEEFASFLDSSLATGDAFMILYAINSLSSWNELKTLRNKIYQDTEGKNQGHRIPMMIVGNKRDLEDEREIPQEELSPEEYAASIRVPYIETSAKTGFNVQEAFQMMMQEVQNIRPDLLHSHRKSRGHSDRSEQRSKKDCRIV